jgi:hypothetical protein
MITVKGPRVCPACGKAGRLLPVSKTANNPLFRSYRCQSCHWQGVMFRPFKKQSRVGFYATLFVLIGFVAAGLVLALALLDRLPER